MAVNELGCHFLHCFVVRQLSGARRSCAIVHATPDRELVSSCILVWLATIILWWTGVRGARLVGRLLLIRDRESALWLKFGFGLFWCSFGVPEVVRLWKLIDL
uniref:Transmembrane protein n=1 Tax=Medicago truncatula TaxID=3880 RepID=Q2HV92_MEDTR|nr:hypothetical protein MtrDRAFT_AC148971g32v2 [Medicago truncatula]